MNPLRNITRISSMKEDEHPMMRRLYLGILAVVVIATLTTVGSLALFSDTDEGVTGTFTAGTVALGEVLDRTFSVANIAPGDSGDQSFSITYAGTSSLNAWLGLSTTVSGDLVNCDTRVGHDGNEFTVSFQDYRGALPENITSLGSGDLTNAQLPDATGAMAPVPPNTTKTIRVNWSLALNAGNTCQGKAATINMVVKAVQSKNNTTGTGPTSWGD